MHTTETFARTVSAMEADTSPAADEAGKDLVATVKEEPQDDIKVCRQYRLYEYLCEPRASHVPVRIHIHIYTHPKHQPPESILPGAAMYTTILPLRTQGQLLPCVALNLTVLSRRRRGAITL